jgi:hypothetical protein
MASGLAQLAEPERIELETFLKSSIMSLDVPGSYAEQVLDVLEALWYTQALKERHFEAWITQLNAQHKKQVIIFI